MNPRVRAWLPLGALVVVAVLAAGLAGAGRDNGRPLDPTSTGPLGTKALVLLLGEMGATVTTSDRLPGAGIDVALVLADNLTPARSQELRAWVEAGGTLVLADPFSDLAPLLARSPAGLFDAVDIDTVLPRDCGLRALQATAEVEVPVPAGFDIPPGATGCFPSAGGSFLVARAEGEGTVVALAGPGLWVNDNLDHADNAVLAVSLLAPRPGTTVRILLPPGPGQGRRSLTDLIRPSVRLALWQLVIAFALFALWRARRLGRPVPEDDPVEVPGAELVVAVGNMLHKAGRRDQAAAMIRHDLRRTLAHHLGLGADAPAEAVVEAVARRSRLPRERIEAVLYSAVPVDDGELVALAATIESLKSEVLHA